jgi:putative transposase
MSCGRYIERNPLAAGLVQQPWDYPWSSCRYYALGEANALLRENPCYTDLATSGQGRQRLWREFLLGEDPKEAVVQREEGNFGDDEYSRRLGERQGRYVRNRRGRPAQSPPTPA